MSPGKAPRINQIGSSGAGGGADVPPLQRQQMQDIYMLLIDPQFTTMRNSMREKILCYIGRKQMPDGFRQPRLAELAKRLESAKGESKDDAEPYD
uniref:Uncharacterized protein n=1 Tax=Leersia perrieri TaxID=77586 RepID=A0A0D9XFH1_9ORYZ